MLQILIVSENMTNAVVSRCKSQKNFINGIDSIVWHWKHQGHHEGVNYCSTVIVQETVLTRGLSNHEIWRCGFRHFKLGKIIWCYLYCLTSRCEKGWVFHENKFLLTVFSSASLAEIWERLRNIGDRIAQTLETYVCAWMHRSQWKYSFHFCVGFHE